MPKVYDFEDEQQECEDCGTELVPISYQGLSKACPECVPDGLIEAYGFTEL